MFSVIAAIGKNYEIGKDNQLIWNIPEDLKFFKEMTLNHKIVMGRKTFESIGKVLPKRKNFIVTSRKYNIPDLYVIEDIDEFIQHHLLTKEEIFVIGGSQLYQKFLPYAAQIYLTEIEGSCVEADTFFPKFDKNKYERKVIFYGEMKNILYKRVVYKKNRKVAKSKE